MKTNKSILILLTFLVAAFLCSCQHTPNVDPIVSKNDGSFDVNATQDGPTSGGDNYSQETISINYEEEFQSTDQSVSFSFQIHENISASSLPIVEVTPHFLTGEDAKRIAEVLFENADFYEAQPHFSTSYTKSEIQEKLNRWAQYTSESAITELFGYPQINAAKVVQDYILDYTMQLESAPEYIERTPCLWQFQESWKYSYTEEQVKAENISISRDDKICATTTWGEIPYQYTVLTRNKADFKFNMISVTLNYGLSPWSIDDMILQARLCRQMKPTEEQIAEVKAKSEKWLADMRLGEWEIDFCEVQQSINGDAIDYRILVKAVPVFEGCPAVRRPQLSDLTSKSTYASNYYLSDAEFYFAPDGTLLSLNLLSPVETVAVINRNPEVLGVYELIQKAQNHLQLSDAYTYGFGAIMEATGQAFECNVYIHDMEYGLSRIKVPNTDDHYYYVPSTVFVGRIEYSSQDTGELYYRDDNVTLLILNAVDGSIIPLING